MSVASWVNGEKELDVGQELDRWRAGARTMVSRSPDVGQELGGQRRGASSMSGRSWMDGG